MVTAFRAGIIGAILMHLPKGLFLRQRGSHGRITRMQGNDKADVGGMPGGQYVVPRGG